MQKIIGTEPEMYLTKSGFVQEVAKELFKRATLSTIEKNKRAIVNFNTIREQI